MAPARAGYVLLRLPLEIKDLFREWLEANVPDRAKHVMALVRSMRGGKDYDSNWNTPHDRHRALRPGDGAPVPHGGEAAGAEFARGRRWPPTSLSARPGLATSSALSLIMGDAPLHL